MLIDILKQEFESRNQKNPRYSLSAFARSLKMHSSTLSAILRGKRKLTAQNAHRILQKLDVDPRRKSQIYLAILEGKHLNPPHPYHTLTNEILQMAGNWEHYAILSLLELPEPNKNIDWVSQKLGLSPDLALKALQRLQTAGLVLPEENVWRLAGHGCTTTVTDVPNVLIRKGHQQYLEKAMYSLIHHNIEERDITGITMAISKAKIPKAKKMIADFRRDLSEFLEADEKDEVYRLNIQLFPIKK